MSGSPGPVATPVGVQQRRGVRLPANTRSVARPSRFGNPHRCEPTPAGRARAVALYRTWLTSHPEVLALAREHLTGYNLACYCPLDGPCHRDVLLEHLTGRGPLPAHRDKSRTTR